MLAHNTYNLILVMLYVRNQVRRPMWVGQFARHSFIIAVRTRPAFLGNILGTYIAIDKQFLEYSGSCWNGGFLAACHSRGVLLKQPNGIVRRVQLDARQPKYRSKRKLKIRATAHMKQSMGCVSSAPSRFDLEVYIDYTTEWYDKYSDLIAHLKTKYTLEEFEYWPDLEARRGLGHVLRTAGGGFIPVVFENTSDRGRHRAVVYRAMSCFSTSGVCEL